MATYRLIGASCFAMLLLVSGCGGSAGVVSAPRSGSPYCNVYTDVACFGVGHGSAVTMSIPADFVLYDVTLADGVSARIYVGYNPQLSRFDAAVPCTAGGDAEVCRFTRRPESLDLLYNSEGSYMDVHVQGGVEAMKGAVVQKFLASFRPCREAGEGLSCSGERIFAAMP